MSSRVCGFTDTTTGSPCDNVVVAEDHCRAGHPCTPSEHSIVADAEVADAGAPFDFELLAMGLAFRQAGGPRKAPDRGPDGGPVVHFIEGPLHELLVYRHRDHPDLYGVSCSGCSSYEGHVGRLDLEEASQLAEDHVSGVRAAASDAEVVPLLHVPRQSGHSRGRRNRRRDGPVLVDAGLSTAA
jgi:hypothetical protein